MPWKYGYKSPKAIRRIRLVEQPPVTTWMRAAPSEYGYLGNVNPEVAPLYAGLDLVKHL